VTDEKGKAAVLTELYLILAVVFWGTNYAATKYAAEHLPQLPIVAFRFTVGGLLLLLVLLLASPSLPGLDWGAGVGAWAAMGFSAVFATAFAFAAWQGGISRIGANRVLVY
jgi:drug/metabolite transporter (DMT)-like permease